MSWSLKNTMVLRMNARVLKKMIFSLSLFFALVLLVDR
jgi:hypothetical protein